MALFVVLDLVLTGVKGLKKNLIQGCLLKETSSNEVGNISPGV